MFCHSSSAHIASPVRNTGLIENGTGAKGKKSTGIVGNALNI
ncbi:hypothetical protein [Wolbachia endosymbiont of Folsomia candida]|nr:hypothetical protein [Wolbachia endosymbiont of Folsomia candida]